MESLLSVNASSSDETPRRFLETQFVLFNIRQRCSLRSIRVGSANCGPGGAFDSMTSESIIAITLLATSALTSGFFAYMHSLRRQAYLMLWSAGWCLLALHYLSPALEPWIPSLRGKRRSTSGCWPRRPCFFSARRRSTRMPSHGCALRSPRAVCLHCGPPPTTCMRSAISPQLGVAVVLCGRRLDFLSGEPAPRNVRGFAAGRFVPQLGRDSDRRTPAHFRISPIRCARSNFCLSCLRRL